MTPSELRQLSQDTVPAPWRTDGNAIYPPDDGPKFGFAANPWPLVVALRNRADLLVDLWEAAESKNQQAITNALDALNAS